MLLHKILVAKKHVIKTTRNKKELKTNEFLSTGWHLVGKIFTLKIHLIIFVFSCGLCYKCFYISYWKLRSTDFAIPASNWF